MEELTFYPDEKQSAYHIPTKNIPQGVNIQSVKCSSRSRIAANIWSVHCVVCLKATKKRNEWKCVSYRIVCMSGARQGSLHPGLDIFLKSRQFSDAEIVRFILNPANGSTSAANLLNNNRNELNGYIIHHISFSELSPMIIFINYDIVDCIAKMLLNDSE